MKIEIGVDHQPGVHPDTLDDIVKYLVQFCDKLHSRTFLYGVDSVRVAKAWLYRKNEELESGELLLDDHEQLTSIQLRRDEQGQWWLFTEDEQWVPEILWFKVSIRLTSGLEAEFLSEEL
ncbi:hypothetical protein [Neptunomonas sp.]|uniref:hypothetical protein n=1 Tax=Neptunomonas sp. TaxID=1971898 RepID=UPI0035690622